MTYIFLSDKPNKCACGESPDIHAIHRCFLDVEQWVQRNHVYYLKKDKQYWVGLFTQIRAEKIGSISYGQIKTPWGYGTYHKSYHRPSDAIKWLRERRYQTRRNAQRKHLDSPVTQYGPEIGEKILKALIDAQKDCACVDNERWARWDKSSDMRRYYRTKNRGCCGSHDDSIVIDSIKYVYGFNYGH